jgi:glycosyltransferase involved in cell wall biosynthesis
VSLRVCRITDNFPPPWSGVSPGAYELTVAQASTGLEMEVITKWRKNCIEVDRGAFFPVHRVRGRIVFFEIMALVKLIRLHRKRRFTLIHSHGSSFFIFHILRRILPSFGIFAIPVVVTVHNIRAYQDTTYHNSDFFSLIEDILCERQELLRTMKKRMLQRHRWLAFKQGVCYRNCDLLFSVSKTFERVLRDEVVKAIGVVTTYNGVSSSFLNEQPKAVHETEEKRLLFVGRLIGTKNEAALLKAFSIIRKIDQTVNLTIIGDGSWRPALERAVKKLGIEGAVRMISSVNHADIVDHYRSADVFVFPSFAEGLPKVLLEAMAVGCAIVASNVDGNNELITNNHNGFLVDPNDYEAMADKILYLLKNPSTAVELGKNAQNTVRQAFSWVAVAERYMQGYRDTIEKM